MQRVRYCALPLLLVSIVTSGCFFTSAIGLRPHGARKGYEVRTEIKEVIIINVFMGVVAFCTERNHLTDFNCEQQFANDAIFASFLGGGLGLLLADVDNETFYTARSVEKCLSNVAFRTLFMTDALLSSKADCSRSTNTCQLDRREVKNAGRMAAILATPSCSLTPTGNLIAAEELNL